MAKETLIELTTWVEENFGESIWLLKCYELSSQTEKAQRIAPGLARKYAEQVTRVVAGDYPFNVVIETYLRLIYALCSSGARSRAVNAADAMVRVAKAARIDGKLPGGMAEFYLAVACVILESLAVDFAGVMTPGSFSYRVARGWRLAEVVELQRCADELRAEITRMVRGKITTPWADIWEYVLLKRLEASIAASKP